MDARPTKEAVLPVGCAAVQPVSKFGRAVQDFCESAELYPLWMHQGRAEVLRRYRRTVLGPLWHTLSLGVFIAVTGVIWSSIMKADLHRYMLFLPSGLIVWGMISAYVVDGTAILTGAQQQALSSRMPYPMLAMALVWRLFLIFLHQLPLCVIFGVLFGGRLDANTLLLIPGTLLAAANGVWMSLLAGLITLKFRDAQSAIASFMHILMFATPVFWSRDLLIGQKIAWLVDANPLYHLVEVMRQPLLGEQPTSVDWLVSTLMLAVGLVVTVFVYGRVRHRIAYWY